MAATVPRSQHSWGFRELCAQPKRSQAPAFRDEKGAALEMDDPVQGTWARNLQGGWEVYRGSGPAKDSATTHSHSRGLKRENATVGAAKTLGTRLTRLLSPCDWTMFAPSPVKTLPRVAPRCVSLARGLLGEQGAMTFDAKNLTAAPAPFSATSHHFPTTTFAGRHTVGFHDGGLRRTRSCEHTPGSRYHFPTRPPSAASIADTVRTSSPCSTYDSRDSLRPVLRKRSLEYQKHPRSREAKGKVSFADNLSETRTIPDTSYT